MRKTSAVSFLLLLIPIIPAAAQIPAVRTESRLILEFDGRRPDTSIVRTISSGNRHRMEFTGHPPASMNPFTGKSTVQIMTFADSDMTIDYLDPSAKTYTEMKPFLIMRKSKEMMAAMGVGMRMESIGDTVTVDSLADTETVMGYRTVHFHSVVAQHFRMRFMGDSSTISMHQTSDFYVSPDAKKLIAGVTDSLLTTAGTGGLMSALGGAMPAGMDSVLRSAASKTQRVNEAGVPLRYSMEMETQTEGRARTLMRQTMEVLKMERVTVPESTFTVPSDYKKSELTLPMGRPPRN